MLRLPPRRAASHAEEFSRPLSNTHNTDKAMTKKLGVAEVPPTKLHAHEEGHVTSFNFTMKDVMHLPGGTYVPCEACMQLAVAAAAAAVAPRP